ncbi:glycosyltransferase family 2 protein [Cucumibacter marinus]|uniref:glycosyltransferase family 2 protein n=1 Tax=Cucumibacter marinus TaxID=1121252 RepID=UPI000410009A|nr:glycosyltransferase family 2 protein [Cucumibacter marinus]
MSVATTDRAETAVLMGTYNGAPFLAEQIASIQAQTIPRLDLIVSDDGSTDGTQALLAEAAAGWKKGQFEVLSGPGKGFSENYRHLLIAHGQSHAFVAFSDQDDIWHPEKLEVAINWLGSQSDKPALYCGRTRYVDAAGNYLRMSPLFRKPPSVHNALVQSIGGGNTMVMNAKAAQLVGMASRNHPFVSHDWWAYLVVTACGGIVRYDATPHIDYRQHQDNVLGANDTVLARLRRATALRQGRFRQWMDIHLTGLAELEPHMTTEARNLIADFRAMRQKGPIARPLSLVRSRLYRQTLLGTMSLGIAVAMGWL